MQSKDRLETISKFSLFMVCLLFQEINIQSVGTNSRKRILV